MRRGTLASSLLLTGPPGIGKQRLALWLAQRVLCEAATAPCGQCQHCKFADAGGHPDILWIFPRPRIKDSTDIAVDEVAADVAEGIQERMEAGGLYARPDGTAGIFVYAARLLVHRASLTPSLARRKVFIVGDAERMVPQASSQEAANAFLKLLEEPPADTTLILTSSEPGALLPTIRSRTIAIRVAPLPDADVQRFLALPAAEPLLKGKSAPELVRLARGAPGTLLDADAKAVAVTRAKAMLDVVTAQPDRLYRVAYSHGSTKARGPFTDMLDALTELVRDDTRIAAEGGDARRAAAGARAMLFIEEAKRDAERNVTPQLIAFTLITRMTEAYA